MSDDRPQVNQPGGVFRESLHSNIAGRERELRAMADAVRRLVRVVTNNVATADETAAAATRIEALAGELEALVPEDTPSRYSLSGPPTEPHDYFPYDGVLGIYNPIALPVQMDWQPPRAVGLARFDTPYEGPPGCVHGAVLAGVFDAVFNVANLMTDVAGPTASLSLEFERMTPLGAPLRFEGWVDAVDGRKVSTVGHVLCEGEITVKARGLFIAFDRDSMDRMRADPDQAAPLPDREVARRGLPNR